MERGKEYGHDATVEEAISPKQNTHPEEHSMKISELMAKNPVAASTEDSVSKASQLMKDKRIRHLPILDEKGTVVGIMTDRDLKRASASDATLLEVHELLYLLNKLRVSDVMTKNPVTVSSESDVKAAAGLMVQNKIGCLPVVESGKLVGILSETDILAHVANS